MQKDIIFPFSHKQQLRTAASAKQPSSEIWSNTMQWEFWCLLEAYAKIHKHPSNQLSSQIFDE